MRPVGSLGDTNICVLLLYLVYFVCFCTLCFIEIYSYPIPHGAVGKSKMKIIEWKIVEYKIGISVKKVMLKTEIK